jgi:preprotein translocase SecF subunit
LLNVIGKRYWYFLLSAIVIVPGALSLVVWHLKLGPDFSGGSDTIVQIPAANQTTQLQSLMAKTTHATVTFVQPQFESGTSCPTQCRYELRTSFLKEKQDTAFLQALKKQYPGQFTVFTVTLPAGGQTSQILNSTRSSAASAKVIHAPKATCSQTCAYRLEASSLNTSAQSGLQAAIANAFPAGKVISQSNFMTTGKKPTKVSKVTVQIPYPGETVTVNAVMDHYALVEGADVEPKPGCEPNCRYVITTQSKLKKSDQPKFASQLASTFRAGTVADFKHTSAVSQLSFDSVSGTVAASTTTDAIEAVIAAAVLILAYITFAFRKMTHPFRYGTAAIIAMLHDVLVVLGIFSILGHFLNVEIDATFVTAMLTIIGFSVHDTIVIFDRIRENVSRRTGESFESVVNHSVMQSFVRSINTSFTVVLTLGAIFLFSGASIRYFVLAMLIGIISGTYSSIFNASPILVVWHTGELKRFFGGKADTDQASGLSPA